MKRLPIKKLIALTVLTVILVSMILSGCADNGGKNTGDTVSYGIWLILGEDTSYYDTYDKNPSIEYLMSKTWGPANKKIDLEFFIPVAGQQADNFNTLLSTGDYPDVMDATMYGGSIVDLYEQGIALDLTEMISQHMPNTKPIWRPIL